MSKFQATYNTFNAVQMDGKPVTSMEPRQMAALLTQGVLNGWTNNWRQNNENRIKIMKILIQSSLEIVFRQKGLFCFRYW